MERAALGSIGALHAATSRVEREALLLTLRDLVVLIAVAAVMLWLWFALTRK